MEPSKEEGQRKRSIDYEAEMRSVSCNWRILLHGFAYVEII